MKWLWQASVAWYSVTVPSAALSTPVISSICQSDMMVCRLKLLWCLSLCKLLGGSCLWHLKARVAIGVHLQTAAVVTNLAFGWKAASGWKIASGSVRREVSWVGNDETRSAVCSRYPSFFPTISRPEGSSGFAPASGQNRGHRCCSKSPVAIISYHLLDASGIVLCVPTQSHSSFSAAAGGAALPADRGTEAWLRVLCGRQATTVATQTEPQSNAWWQRMDLILANPPKGSKRYIKQLPWTPWNS